MQKKMLAVLGLMLGITRVLFGQAETERLNGYQLFNPPYFSISEAWHFDLGKGNFLELELTQRSELPRFQNVDSLLLVFLADMKPFSDSLSDPLSGKHIYYRVDSAGRKMVHIGQTQPTGSTFLLGEGDPSLLRLRQDTIQILLQAPAPGSGGKGTPQVLYDRLTLVLNRYDQLEGLVSSGLNGKIREIGTGRDKKYDQDFEGGGRLASDHSITIKKEGVYTAPPNGNYLEIQGQVGVQNFKNYFATSVPLGATLGFKNGWNIHFVSAYWEPLFLFAPDQQGHLHTYRNDMVVLGYGFGRTDTKTLKPVLGNFNFSLGWFVHREGDFFTGSSFRLTGGELELPAYRLVIRPGIYFNDFFKGVTPTLQIAFKFL
jgi:hypothetical protein